MADLLSPLLSLSLSLFLSLDTTLRILVHESDFSGVTDPFNLVEAFSITDTLLSTF